MREDQGDVQIGCVPVLVLAFRSSKWMSPFRRAVHFGGLPRLRSRQHRLEALDLDRNAVGLCLKDVDPLAQFGCLAERLVFLAQRASGEIFPV